MKYCFLFLICSLFLSNKCTQTYNSNSDDNRFTNVGCNIIDDSTQGGSELKESCTVIEQRCTNCHSGYHDQWTNITTNQEWFETGNFTLGGPESSLFYTKLKNVGGNMPDGLPQISETEFTTIKTWIENMTLN